VGQLQGRVWRICRARRPLAWTSGARQASVCHSLHAASPSGAPHVAACCDRHDNTTAGCWRGAVAASAGEHERCGERRQARRRHASATRLRLGGNARVATLRLAARPSREDSRRRRRLLRSSLSGSDVPQYSELVASHRQAPPAAAQSSPHGRSRRRDLPVSSLWPSVSDLPAGTARRLDLWSIRLPLRQPAHGSRSRPHGAARQHMPCARGRGVGLNGANGRERVRRCRHLTREPLSLRPSVRRLSAQCSAELLATASIFWRRR
jgi:hypothetical protein